MPRMEPIGEEDCRLDLWADDGGFCPPEYGD